MRNGKLNKTERNTLARAEEILNNLIDWHDDSDTSTLDDYYISMLCNAAGGIDQYLSITNE